MSSVYIRAEDICIETDEDGYSLLISDEDSGNSIRVNIQHIVLDFYKNVQAEIRPYVLEMESARAAVAAGVSLDDYLGTDLQSERDRLWHALTEQGGRNVELAERIDELDRRLAVPQLVTNRPVDVQDAIDAGYALDDPKSPGFHDRMVGDA